MFCLILRNFEHDNPLQPILVAIVAGALEPVVGPEPLAFFYDVRLILAFVIHRLRDCFSGYRLVIFD